MKELMTHPAFREAKVIKLLGYSNGNRDYKKAKEAIEKGWPPLDETQRQKCMDKNYWLGGVISEGYIVLDIDDKEKGQTIFEGLLKAGYSFIGIETPNGYQFIFCDAGKVKNQSAKRLTLCGITFDYRLANKGYIVLPTSKTEGRMIKHLPPQDLDPMPLCFSPVIGKKKTDEELDRIFEGSRTTTFISHASKIREWNIAHALKLTIEEKRQVLSEIDRILCYPPLGKTKVEEILQSAESYQTISTPQKVTEVTVEPVIIDKDLIPVYPFPFDVFPQELFDVIEKISDSLHVEPEIVASAILTIISGAIGNTIRISPKKGYEVSPFIWLIIIALSGYGKSPVTKTLLKYIKRLQADAYKEYQEETKEYEKTLKKAKQNDGIEHLPEKPRLKHYLISDCTVEALANVFENDSRGIIIYQDEIAGLILGLDQYKAKGNDRQHYLELFNCDSLKIDRKSEVKFIYNTGASIIGGIQPKVMPKIFNENSFDDGLLPRFLLINSVNKSLKFSRQEITEDTISYWIGILKWCYEIPLIWDDTGFVKSKVLCLNSDALDAYEKFYNDYGVKLPFLSDKVKVFLPKLSAYYCLKFAGVLHVIETFADKETLTPLIEKETVQKAIKLTQYFAGQVIKALRLYQKPEDTLNEFQKRLIEILYNLQGEVKNGRLRLSRITEEFKKVLPYPLTPEPEKISSMLRHFDLTTEKSTGNYSYLLWESEKIEKLFYEKTVTTVTTVTKESLNTDKKVTEVTEVTDDIEKMKQDAEPIYIDTEVE